MRPKRTTRSQSLAGNPKVAEIEVTVEEGMEEIPFDVLLMFCFILLMFSLFSKPVINLEMHLV